MQTEEILEKIWTLIQTFGGVRFTSTIKTKLDQEREITINFSIRPEEEQPLLDGLPGKPGVEPNLPGVKTEQKHMS